MDIHKNIGPTIKIYFSIWAMQWPFSQFKSRKTDTECPLLILITFSLQITERQLKLSKGQAKRIYIFFHQFLSIQKLTITNNNKKKTGLLVAQEKVASCRIRGHVLVSRKGFSGSRGKNLRYLFGWIGYVELVRIHWKLM